MDVDDTIAQLRTFGYLQMDDKHVIQGLGDTCYVYTAPEPTLPPMTPVFPDFKISAEPAIPLRYGGISAMKPGFSIITTHRPCPKLPGVEAMLDDGWRWQGWEHFARGYGRRQATYIHVSRVEAGRYANRLPTNRARKKLRNQVNRRKRRAC